jgi:hypothetical protein
MKKVLLLLSCSLLASASFADDLTATVTNATVGLSDGAIDLIVSGGVAPYTYSWSGPGGFTASTEDLTGLDAGSYTVNVTDAYCGIATQTFVVATDTNVAVNPALALSAVEIFPNPFAQELNVSFNSPVQGDALLQLSDAAGRLVRSQSVMLQASNALKLTFDRPLASGVYLLTVSSRGELLLKSQVLKD